MNKTVVKYLALSSLALGGLVYSTETAHAQEASVTRIEGANRFETAANISQHTYDKAETVIIVNARGFADALAGAPLAYQKNAPILLAQGGSLHSATIDEIERLEATNAIILGGEAAVSEGIANELDNLGLGVERIAGDNRFDTAEKIADSLGELVQSDKAVVVDGFEFADAMSVAPFAAREGMPIFLTRTNSLTSADALANFDQTYIIGGEHAVSSTVEDQLNNPMRLEGANRYATNLAVMSYFEINADQLFISTGLDYVDALTGSVLAAQENSGVALVRNGVSSSLREFITARDLSTTIFGGEAAVSHSIMRELGGEYPEPIPSGLPNGTIKIGENGFSGEMGGYEYSLYKSIPGGGHVTKAIVDIENEEVLLTSVIEFVYEYDLSNVRLQLFTLVSRDDDRYNYIGDWVNFEDREIEDTGSGLDGFGEGYSIGLSSEVETFLLELGYQFLDAHGM